MEFSIWLVTSSNETMIRFSMNTKRNRIEKTELKADKNINQNKKEHIILSGSTSLNSWSFQVVKKTTIVNDTSHKQLESGFIALAT